MKTSLLVTGIVVSLSSAGCVAGPGGSNNAANRTILGAAAGAALGGAAGKAVGTNVMTGAVVGAVAGAAAGAAINPNHGFKRDTRGTCVLVDEYGRTVFDDKGQPIIDYANPC